MLSLPSSSGSYKPYDALRVINRFYHKLEPKYTNNSFISLMTSIYIQDDGYISDVYYSSVWTHIILYIKKLSLESQQLNESDECLDTRYERHDYYMSTIEVYQAMIKYLRQESVNRGLLEVNDLLLDMKLNNYDLPKNPYYWDLWLICAEEVSAETGGE
jgi:hypothetical protein